MNANTVPSFITAVQSAVVAIENEVGTAANRNYVRKDREVTIAGLMTSRTGAEFGAVATRDCRNEFVGSLDDGRSLSPRCFRLRTSN